MQAKVKQVVTSTPQIFRCRTAWWSLALFCSSSHKIDMAKPKAKKDGLRMSHYALSPNTQVYVLKIPSK